MVNYLKNYGAHTLLAIIALKLVVSNEISTAFCVFYCVLILSLLAYTLSSKYLLFKEKQTNSLPEVQELKEEVKRMRSTLNALTLRYGFESQLP